MSLLTDIEEDAFKELFNLSFGKVASTLSEMVDSEVALKVPFFCTLHGQSVSAYVQSLYGMAISLVGMRFRFVFPPDNAIAGMAVLILRGTKIGHFLDAWYGGHVPEETLAYVEEEAMPLAGDVLLYTCTSSLSALFGSDVDCEKPQFFKGTTEDLPGFLALPDLPGFSPSEPQAEEDRLLLLRVDFSLVGKDVDGSLLTWMGGYGLPRLRSEIDHFIATHMV
ncbi:MAG: hypothetical protein HQM03_16075 [Magnetococcales bacterium]|nr:hypothetical protein [Magnetococcales bacterium]